MGKTKIKFNLDDIWWFQQGTRDLLGRIFTELQFVESKKYHQYNIKSTSIEAEISIEDLFDISEHFNIEFDEDYIVLCSNRLKKE